MNAYIFVEKKTFESLKVYLEFSRGECVMVLSSSLFNSTLKPFAFTPQSAPSIISVREFKSKHDKILHVLWTGHEKS